MILNNMQCKKRSHTHVRQFGNSRYVTWKIPYLLYCMLQWNLCWTVWTNLEFLFSTFSVLLVWVKMQPNRNWHHYLPCCCHPCRTRTIYCDSNHLENRTALLRHKVSKQIYVYFQSCYFFVSILRIQTNKEVNWTNLMFLPKHHVRHWLQTSWYSWRRSFVKRRILL